MLFAKIALLGVMAVATLAGNMIPSNTIVIEPASREATLGSGESQQADKTPVENKISNDTEKPKPKEVEDFVRRVARIYKLDEYLFVETLRKESGGFNVLAFNPRDVDGKPKIGIAQFDIETWAYGNKRFGINLDINEWKSQIFMTALFWKVGQEYRWGAWWNLVKANY